MKINLRSFLAGVLLVLLLGGVVFFIKRNKPAPVPTPVAPHVAAHPGVLKVLGPEDAPVKLVVFSDFECPSCRVASEAIHEILLKYPGKIQLAYKHFPLTSHKWSVYAHQAAECMNRQGKFWPYHDTLYEKQSEWAPSKTAPVEILARYAGELGADMERFGACMADVDVTRAIYAEKEEGNQRQVNATPTFFLGEERFVGPKELQGRGEDAIRKILGLPEIPLAEKKLEPLMPAPLKGAAQ